MKLLTRFYLLNAQFEILCKPIAGSDFKQQMIEVGLRTIFNPYVSDNMVTIMYDGKVKHVINIAG